MINLIKKSKSVRFIALLLASSTFLMSFKMNKDGEVVLPAGTSIPLTSVSMIYSDVAYPGQMVYFNVRSDVSVDGNVVIKAGATAVGQVVRAQRAKGLGKEGFVEIQLLSAKAVDGKDIMLTGPNLTQEGDDRLALAVILGLVVCILFLTIKGKNAEIPPGFNVNALTASSNSIKI